MTRRYGLPREPESREFGYAEGREVKTFVFHPRLDVGFDEVIEFARLRQQWNDLLNEDAKRFSEELRAIGAERNARRDEESGQIVSDLTDEEYTARVKEVERKFTEQERERFAGKVELVLYLVQDHDHDAFRPILLKSHPDDVSQLLEGLRQEVISRTSKQVEAVMGVDPSSPASPSA